MEKTTNTKKDLIERLGMLLTKHEGSKMTTMLNHIIEIESNEFVRSYLEKTFEINGINFIDNVSWKLGYSFQVNREDVVKKVVITSLDLNPIRNGEEE